MGNVGSRSQVGIEGEGEEERSVLCGCWTQLDYVAPVNTSLQAACAGAVRQLGAVLVPEVLLSPKTLREEATKFVQGWRKKLFLPRQQSDNKVCG